MSTYTAKHKAYYEANKEKILAQRLERERAYNATPQGKYSVQKRKARQRGIQWKFTFDSWWGIWEASGQWENRGDTGDKACMSRYGDTGPYSPTNVFISTMSQNTFEAYLSNGVDELGRIKPKVKIGE